MNSKFEKIISNSYRNGEFLRLNDSGYKYNSHYADRHRVYRTSERFDRFELNGAAATSNLLP